MYILTKLGNNVPNLKCFEQRRLMTFSFLNMFRININTNIDLIKFNITTI